ncbi:MAG: hypothetical protein WAV85_05805 [Rhodoferax sp.]
MAFAPQGVERLVHEAGLGGVASWLMLLPAQNLERAGQVAQVGRAFQQSLALAPALA